WAETCAWVWKTACGSGAARSPKPMGSRGPRKAAYSRSSAFSSRTATNGAKCSSSRADGTSHSRGERSMKSYRIAVIPGDGIGKEVVPEGLRVLEAAGRKFGIELKWDEFPWSCEYRLKHGRMMPEDGLATIRNHDAVFFGACGFPGVPDHVSLWELLIPMRRGFDLYVNLRPVRLMPGIQSPLAGRKQGDIDFWVVRENTEGEYSAIGGRIFEGTERETVVQQSTFTRAGTDRILKYAYDLARSRPKKHLT